MREIFKKYDLTREDLALNLLPGGKRLLDVGCGAGYLLSQAKWNFERVYGIDTKIPRIKNVYFKKTDINKGLPFRDNFFDVVTCISVLQFVLDPYFVTGEINRVLKKQGILIINVPNIAYLKQRIKLLFGILPRTSYAPGWDGNTFHYFTLKSLKKLLREKAFKVQKISGSGIFAKYRNWWPSVLCGDLLIKAQKVEKAQLPA